MKKYGILFLTLIVVFSFVSCNSNDYTQTSSNETMTENTTEATSSETMLIISEPAEVETTEEIKDIITENPFNVKFDHTDDEYIFYYTAPISGVYRFDMSTDDATCDYNLKIYDSIKNEICNDDYSCYLHGRTLTLNKDETYKIVLTQLEGFPTAIITIGIPNEEKNISNHTVSGKINYIGQEDNYIFHTELSGFYRFDFKTDNSDYNYNVTLKNEINEELFCLDYNVNSHGKGIYLNENEEYKLQVKQEEGTPQYDILISVPLPPTNVSKSFSGSITFIDQQNIYYFTPNESGLYNISILFGNEDGSCKLTLKDNTNLELFSTTYESPKEVELDKDMQYKFIVDYNNLLLDYDVIIEKV
ncbi:hypothetical protein [uncultured Eubacterium sp.]|uniref:hypothetical protein n=1 Tax=uncultured Eubacterium sp. TaxID=165185 RepID=UPI0025F2267C|nr:hypothetical protein [uncultured Eubacterium sp.]